MNDAYTELEDMIDTHTVEGLLNMLADICVEKAEHITTTWEDAVAAAAWRRSAKMLTTLAGKISI